MESIDSPLSIVKKTLVSSLRLIGKEAHRNHSKPAENIKTAVAANTLSGRENLFFRVIINSDQETPGPLALALDVNDFILLQTMRVCIYLIWGRK